MARLRKDFLNVYVINYPIMTNREALEAAYTDLSPGGYFVCVTPNMTDLLNRFRVLARRSAICARFLMQETVLLVTGVNTPLMNSRRWLPGQVLQYWTKKITARRPSSMAKIVFLGTCSLPCFDCWRTACPRPGKLI